MNKFHIVSFVPLVEGYRETPKQRASRVDSLGGSPSYIGGEAQVETLNSTYTLYNPPRQRSDDSRVFITASGWKLKNHTEGGIEIDIESVGMAPLKKGGWGISKEIQVRCSLRR